MQAEFVIGYPETFIKYVDEDAAKSAAKDILANRKTKAKGKKTVKKMYVFRIEYVGEVTADEPENIVA